VVQPAGETLSVSLQCYVLVSFSLHRQNLDLISQLSADKKFIVNYCAKQTIAPGTVCPEPNILNIQYKQTQQRYAKNRWVTKDFSVLYYKCEIGGRISYPDARQQVIVKRSWQLPARPGS
jgi:hypothetical protein